MCRNSLSPAPLVESKMLHTKLQANATTQIRDKTMRTFHVCICNKIYVIQEFHFVRVVYIFYCSIHLYI